MSATFKDFLPAPVPVNEGERLAALHQYQILDTPAEDIFDVITRFAADACGTPISFLSFVDRDRQWFKSKVGLEVSETPRGVAFCAHAILQPDPLIVHDALQDGRFAANPLVTGEPRIRFYAGAPVVAPGGRPLGTVAVVDHVPRELHQDRVTLLSSLSRWVASELELRRILAVHRQAETAAQEVRGSLLRNTLKDLEAAIERRTAELGEAVSLLSVEMTQRQQAAEASRESDAALRRLLQAIPHEKFRVCGDGTVQDHMPGRAVKFSFFSTDPVGRKLSEILPGDMAERHVSLVHQALVTGLVHSHECQLPAMAGQRNYVCHTVPIDLDTALLVVRDTTERRRTEEQVQHLRAEIAHATRFSTMGEMASGLAHELNQPLSAVVNYIEGCVHRLQGGADDAHAEIEEMLREAVAEARRAGRIIDRLREFVRWREPHRSTVDINSLVRDVLVLVKGEFHRSGTRLRLDLAESLPPLLADRIQLTQVLLNLLSNALAAMSETPLAERVIDIKTARLDAERIEVSVIDRGCGLSPEVSERVFGPFFTTKPQGMGLGLSITRAIIEAHGGKIRAHSNPDAGACFRFTLPIGAEEQKS